LFWAEAGNEAALKNGRQSRQVGAPQGGDAKAPSNSTPSGARSAFGTSRASLEFQLRERASGLATFVDVKAHIHRR